MATKPSTHHTTFEFDGFERNITVTFWYNEITMEVNEIEKIVLTDTDQSLDFILSDEELTAHLSERIKEEGAELREQAAYERATEDYMSEYL